MILDSGALYVKQLQKGALQIKKTGFERVHLQIWGNAQTAELCRCYYHEMKREGGREKNRCKI